MKTERQCTAAEGGNYVRYLIPVTLRELEQAGVTLDSDMGADAAEHDELLDEEGIFRIAITVDGEGSGPDYDVLCLSAPLGEELRWMQCLGPRLDGSRVATNEYMLSQGRVEALAWEICASAAHSAEGTHARWWDEDYEDDEYLAQLLANY